MSNTQDDWRQWFDRHGATLVLFARRWVPSVADAEVVVQEAFVRFWRSRERARDPTAYLYACVRRAAVNWLRRESRRQRHEDAAGRERPVDITLQSESVERDERRREIEQAIGNLPAEQGAALVMKIWGGLTFPQIAEALQISPNTAASRYRYALHDLRKLLAEETV